MKQSARQDHIDELFRLIASLEDPEDVRALFDDMCTIKEIENIAERCHAAMFSISLMVCSVRQGLCPTAEKGNGITETLSRNGRAFFMCISDSLATPPARSER